MSAAPSAVSAEGLGFGLLSVASAEAVTGYWRPLLDALGDRLGLKVEPRMYDDYAGVIWAMKSGEVQIAMLGNKSAIEAVDRAGGEVAFQAEDLGGQTQYFSHLIAGSGSQLSSVEDVFSKACELTFGDGDINSTSGHVIPGYYLFTTRGVDPREIFKRVVQNNHENNFLGVAEGRIDVATSNNVELERYLASHPNRSKEVKIIWTSPAIPSDPIVWRADLPGELKARIKDFLLDYGRPSPGKPPARLAKEKEILARMARAGFRESDNRQLAPIRIIELSRQRSHILTNDAIDPEERLRRLDDIDEKMQALENR
ncbi:MAG: phosphate/phosphite/phosphonate ABC transporter substrate-binding protein [Desulfovibrionaceae bacterium]|nr:phosphate/phosphite/phosphonate ABC transporter substrate-binding protein [Desulfovibrionaceae bacterium]MBF0512442.1 phosphate/phosphite/phosphonate ABC transporter substrate-binding protein [Desulfovibrionaceae bacterium]